MKTKLSFLAIILLILASVSFVVVGYSMWKLELKEERTIDVESYDVSTVEGVTVTNTENLVINVFSFEQDTLTYSISSIEKINLKITLEVQDETILASFIDSVKFDNATKAYSTANGVVTILLSNISLNTNHTLSIKFNTSSIYNANFNTSGILDNNSKTLLTVYDGE